MNNIQPHQYIPEFGLSSAHLVTNCSEMQEYIGNKMGWGGEYNAVTNDMPFYSFSASARINDLTITSVANSQIYAKVLAEESSSIFLPTAGKTGKSIVNGKTIHWGVNAVGLFAPPGDRTGYFGDCSVIIMDINHQRMQNTLNIMLGKEVNIRVY